MMPTPEIDVVQVGSVLGGATGIGLLGRWVVSLFVKQNVTDAGNTGHVTLIKELQEEAKKWRLMLDEEKAENAKQRSVIEAELRVMREGNILLRAQNQMLRMILLNKGVSEAELTAIGAIPE
jgi:hypothetical protein